MNIKRIPLYIAVSASTMTFWPQALAQEAALEEIVVTAQRREQAITEVPISITVVDAAQLDRQRINELADLAQAAPSLELVDGFTNSPGGAGSIRGIGTSTFNSGATSAVGIVIDQVPLGNANITNLFDIAQIEVLKGPQGTLFGLTTSAGIINISTNAPDPSEFSGRIGADFSSRDTLGSGFGQQVLRGVVNIPTGDNSALRIAGIANMKEGPGYNHYLDERDESDAYSVRARFLANPTDDLRVDLIADYADSDARGANFFSAISGSDEFRQSVSEGCNVTVSDDNAGYCMKKPQNLENDNFGFSANIAYDMGDMVLTSISAYRDATRWQDWQSIFRMDTEFFNLENGPIDDNTEQFSQELRLESDGNSAMEWTLGLFYSESELTREPRTFYRTRNRPPSRGGPITDVIRERGVITIDSDSVAAFGQATWHTSERLHLTAGLRYTSADLSYNQQTPDGGSAVPGNLDSNEVSWRFAAQYDVADDINAYVSATRGFKPGQVTLPNNPNADPEIINPEMPTSYEAGLKMIVADGVVIDLNAFYSDVKDYQAQQCIQERDATGQVIGIDCNDNNVDGVKAKGFEINAYGQVSDSFRVNTGFMLAKTQYPDGYLDEEGNDLGGEQLLNVPEMKFTLSGNYDTALTQGLNGFVGFDAVWKSEVNYQQSTNPDNKYPSHWILGGQVGIRSADDRWQVSIFGRNLTDEHEPANLLANHYDDGATAAILTTRAFREVGVSFDLNF